MGKKVLLLLVLVIMTIANLNAAATWIPTSGPERVVTNSFYTAGNVIIAATQLTGVYVSRNFGATWVESNVGILRDIDSLYYIYDFTFRDNTLYAATSTGLYKSYNTGQSWTLVTPQVFSSLTSCGNYIFASDLNDVFKSSDGGSTWTSAGLTNITSLVSNNQILFAAERNSSNVYKTQDFGSSWSVISSSFAPESFVNKLYFDGERLFALGANAAYVSANLGENWTTCTGFRIDGYNATGIIYSEGVHYMSHNNEIYRSVDGGITWELIPEQLRWLSHRCLGAVAGIIFLGNSNSIYKSADGGNSWTSSSNGFPKISPLISVSGGYIYAGSTFQMPYGGIWYSSNAGNIWNLSSNNPLYSIYSKNNYVIAGITNQGIIRSADRGASWSMTNIDWGNAGGFAIDGDTVFACPNRTSGHPGASVMKSTDGGITFTAISPDWKSYNAGIVTTLRNVFVINSLGLHRSSDYGQTWEIVQNILYPEFITSYGPRIYIVDKFGKMWYTVSLGYAWASMNGEGIQNKVIKKMAVSQGMIIATDGFKIYKTIDHGVRWIDMSFGLPYPSGSEPLITDIAIDNNYAYAGITKGGVWKLSLSTGVGNQNENISEYRLEQNYPNPFNPSTAIQYAVPKDGNVKLSVYDVSGKLITTLVNGYRKQGVYEVSFSGSGYSSGVYFYRIEAEGFVQVKKMSLIK